MLGSPHGQLLHLQMELENKIAEITTIKKKLEVELQDGLQASALKQSLRTCGTRLRSTVGALRQLLSDVAKARFGEWLPGLHAHLLQLIAHFRQADRREMTRLSLEVGKLAAHNRTLLAELAELKEAGARHPPFQKKRAQQDVEQEPCLAKLRKCEAACPASKLVAIDRLSEEMSRSPALEFHNPHLETIHEEEEATPSMGPKTKIVKAKPSEITSATIVKTEPSENSVVMPSNRPESQRPAASKDLHRVCIEDLARMIDKVTPSKMVIKGFADRLAKKVSLHDEDQENVIELCSKMKPWARQSHHTHLARQPPPTIIELGGKRRSSSKEPTAEAHGRTAEAPLRDASALRSRDNNLTRSKSKEKIKVTVKDSSHSQLSKSKTITRTADRRSSYSSTCNARPNSHLSLLSEQLGKLELYVGDRRYELRYEGTKKEHQRCGTGKLEYINGLVYHGEFKDDVRHGYGVLTMHGKEIYQGHWLADQLHGRGHLRNLHYISRRKLPEDSFLRSITYEGEFKSNTLHGVGCITLANGHRVEGYFCSNTPQGELTPVDKLCSAETSQFPY